MTWITPTAEFDFRQTATPADHRVGLLGLFTAAGIGAVMAIVLKDPFAGQIPSVAILGLLEICLVVAIVRGVWRRRKATAFGRGELSVSEDRQLLAYARQLSREHQAYREVLKTLASGTQIDECLSAVVDAAESILPGCLCCFVEAPVDGAELRLVPHRNSHTEQLASSVFKRLLDSRAGKDLFRQLNPELEDLVIPNAIEGLDEDLRQLLSSREVSSCQLYSLSVAGGSRWGILALWYPVDMRDTVRGEAGVIAHLATAAIERSLLIRRLNEKTERMLLAERVGKIGIWDWDVRTQRVIWSDQMAALLQMQPGSLKGEHSEWRALVLPEDIEPLEAALRKGFEEGAKSYYRAYRMLLPDGKIHWMESFGEISYDAEGKPLRMVGTSHDITEQKELLERSEEARRTLELVLDAAKLGFWDWDIPTGHGYFGGCWATMLGYSPNEINPHVSSWEKLVHPDDLPRVMRVLTEHLEGRTPVYECEHRLKKKDGTWLWVMDRGRVVKRDGENKPLRALGIHADISEQRASQETLQLAAKRKDEFLATLAHELRNPLAPIRTGLQILKRLDLVPEGQQARTMMERQLLQMVRLVDDLLDVARITQGRIELKRAQMLLQDAVAAGVEGAKPLLDAAGQELTTEVTPDPILLNGDQVRLAQVVSNILGNAAKYTPRGGSIHLRVFRENGTATIAISDNGLGIPSEKLEAIFEMFGQVNQTLDRSQGGLGIGLAIVRKIVEMHGGDVRAESAGAGKGSTFTIHIPVIPRPAMTLDTKIDVEKQPSVDSRRVLVVDDNLDGAESLALFISVTGHSAEVAHDSTQALSAVQHRMPDVIFLDIGLPGMSGYEVARRIRSLPGGDRVRLVALTGWGTEADKQKAEEAGFSEHLTKPVDLVHVERILGSATPTAPSAIAASATQGSPTASGRS